MGKFSRVDRQESGVSEEVVETPMSPVVGGRRNA